MDPQLRKTDVEIALGLYKALQKLFDLQFITLLKQNVLGRMFPLFSPCFKKLVSILLLYLQFSCDRSKKHAH